MQKTATTPSALGFRMPAEWERHAATWIAWPHNQSDWPGKFAPIPWLYGDIARLLARGERVCILVQDAAEERAARRVLAKCGVDLERVELHRRPTDRVWTRDSGPLFLTRKDDLALCAFKFNAWAKYDDYRKDAKVPAYLAKRLKLRAFEPRRPEGNQRVVLEGGSIDVDGRGHLLTTEECLLSEVQARNPGLARDALERVLAGALGVRKVLWLDRGIAGDDTHGHVDDLARFVRPGVIAIASEADKGDENHAPLRENLTRARAFRDLDGKPFEVIPIPLPAPVRFAGQRLPASYLNFYIANTGVLVPVFNDPNDARALAILGEAFADRPVIPVYCRDLVLGLGTLHCMTQQQPG